MYNDPSRYIPDFGDRRCVGWFDNIQEAECAVENNFANMHDDMYEYAIIEKIESGILIADIDREIFKWNNTTQQYNKIEEPIELSKSRNFGIG